MIDPRRFEDKSLPTAIDIPVAPEGDESRVVTQTNGYATCPRCGGSYPALNDRPIAHQCEPPYPPITSYHFVIAKET